MRINTSITTNQTFLNAALQGQNAGWRYLLGILLAMLFFMGGYLYVGIPIAEAIAPHLPFGRNVVHTNEIQVEIEAVGANSLAISYISSHIAFAFLGIGILSAVKLLHQRKMLTLVSPDASFQVKRFGLGFGLWFALASLQTFIEFLLQPEAFVWNFQPLVWLVFLPLALLLTPIQTSAEELLFRGYLLQGLGLLVRSPLALMALSGSLFAIVHFGNPEMGRGAVWIALTYLVMGIFLTVITLKDNRLELAMGVHAANNLFIVLFVNTQDSVLQTPAIVLQQIPTDPKLTFVEILVSSIIFYVLLLGKQRKRAKIAD